MVFLSDGCYHTYQLCHAAYKNYSSAGQKTRLTCQNHFLKNTIWKRKLVHYFSEMQSFYERKNLQLLDLLSDLWKLFLYVFFFILPFLHHVQSNQIKKSITKIVRFIEYPYLQVHQQIKQTLRLQMRSWKLMVQVLLILTIQMLFPTFIMYDHFFCIFNTANCFETFLKSFLVYQIKNNMFKSKKKNRK